MLKKMSLKLKLILICLLIGLVPLLITSSYVYFTSQSNTKVEIFRGWELVFHMTKLNLLHYFEDIEEDTTSLSYNKEIAESMKALEEIGWNINSSLWEHEKNEFNDYIAKIASYSGGEHIVLLDPKGIAVFSTSSAELGLDYSNRGYFQKAFKGEGNWSEIFYSDIYNADVKAFAVPIFDQQNNNKIIGVLATVIQRTHLAEIVLGEIKQVSDTADAYLIDATGLLLTRSLKAGRAQGLTTYIKTKAVETLAPAIRAKNNNFVMQDEYKAIDGSKVIGIGSYVELGAEDFGFLIEIEDKEVFAFLKKMSNRVLIFIFIALLIIVLSSVLLSASITRPLIAMVDLMVKAEKGDLTVQANVDRGDELGQLATSFNGLINGTSESVGAILAASNQVEGAANEVSDAADQMASGAESQASSIEELTATMEEMSASIQEVSDNVQDTAEFSEDVAKTMVEMSASIQDISQNAQLVAHEMDAASHSIKDLENKIQESAEEAKSTQIEVVKTMEVTEAGSDQVEKSILEMESINSAVIELAKAIHELGGSASHIGDIIEVIDDIAEQTNLLALNAAIEAARAGEHGKGFAVVAGAIGDLAAKSQEATQDIGKLIKSIQGDVNAAIKTTEDGAKKVEQGVESVQTAGLAFKEIYEAVSNVTGRINIIVENIMDAASQSLKVQEAIMKANTLSQDVTATTEEQAASVEEIVKAVEKMADLSREVAASMEEQAASSDEMVRATENVNHITAESAAASEEVASSGNELKGLAEDLIAIVNRFKIK